KGSYRYRALHQFDHQHPVFFACWFQLSYLVCHYQALGVDTNFPDWICGHWLDHEYAEPEDKNDTTKYQPRNNPHVGHHHRVAPQHRARQEPWPYISRNPAYAGAYADHFR